MDVLWAPWRMAYVGGASPPHGCIFCAGVRAGDDARDLLVLGTTPGAVVMLNRYPYASGHVMIAPRRHTADLPNLAAEEHADLAETLRRSVAALERALAPQGMNIGMNLGTCAGAGIVDHLHWHVVPRWTGDTNFMTTVADARVMPQHLLDTYDRLHPAFAWLDGG
jgi:ATP adenylyltransferase